MERHSRSASFGRPAANTVANTTGVCPECGTPGPGRDRRPRDSISKMKDYAINGVRECWLIDPLKDRMAFDRLCDGRYAEVAPGPGGFASEAVPGFVLDTEALRRKFHSL